MINTLNKLEYYYENEAEEYLFYRVPQMLFTDKRFSKISSDAKLLYSLFLNRMSLSRKNGMFDEEKRVYIYFSIEEVMEVFGIASQKATKIIAELDDVRGCGLIHRKKSGQGKPARIYVMKYTSVVYEELIKDNIDYDILVENNPNVDIGGIVEIMLDAICSGREYLDINQDKVPKEIVKSRLLKIDSEHINYVIECLQKNTTKVKNIRNYLLTALYNSYETLDHYYRSEVNYDLYGNKQNP